MQWRLNLTHQYRQQNHRAAKGSGYSILFAKHLACGSIPFAESDGLIDCISVDDSVRDAIMRDACIKECEPGRPPTSLKCSYLSLLPAAHRLRIYGAEWTNGTEGTGNPNEKGMRRGSLVDSTSRPRTATWSTAVTGIAFGGFVPQANKTLVDAVQFTVGGRINPCSSNCKRYDPCINLVNALASLRDTINEKSPGWNLFGDNEEKIQDHSTVPETNCLEAPTTRHTGALFARYMTLLERMIAMSRSTMDDVYQECCDIVEDSYNNAVSKEAKVKDGGEDDRKCDEEELTSSVKAVDEKVKQGIITTGDCAIVARCLIAAWAWRVRRINDLQIRSRYLPHGQNDGEPIGAHTAAMEDLPSVSALG